MAKEVTPPGIGGREQVKNDIKWAAALMILVVIAVTSFTLQQWWVQPLGSENLGPWTTTGGTEQPGLTEELFTVWVVPFELLSVLLLAALVASVVLAIREGPGFSETAEAGSPSETPARVGGPEGGDR